MDIGELKGYSYIEFDHEYAAPSCDPTIYYYGFDFLHGENGILRKCLYGKDTIEQSLIYAKKFWNAYKNNKKFLRIVNTYAHEYIGEKSKYAGTTLIREVRAVFLALDRSLEEGRAQVSRIVGRDTSQLSAQEVRTAALETLAENLSDGVIAPLFWLLLLGTPGMLAYKMVNTLDSMIGYRTDRYRDFGCWAARLDDAANYLPARLTALLMVIASGFSGYSGLSGSSGYSGLPRRLAFVRRYARCHASPNSGYPEAALAGILDCRFGGPHLYFGQLFDKPYIGSNDRPLTTNDMLLAVRINRTAELMMVVMMVILSLLDYRCLLTVFL